MYLQKNLKKYYYINISVYWIEIINLDSMINKKYILKLNDNYSWNYKNLNKFVTCEIWINKKNKGNMQLDSIYLSKFNYTEILVK